jgi:hypothetical protein
MKCRSSIALTLLFTAIIGSSLLAGLQDPVPPTLRELARQNGGTFKEWMHSDGPLAPLAMLAAEADLIVEGHISAKTTRLSKSEIVVLTVFTLVPERIFKDKLRIGTLPTPGPTKALTFFEVGGAVDVDGLHIELTTDPATKPPLEVGETIIGFFVRDAEDEALRVHHADFGVLRVRDGTVIAANDRVARFRPLEHTSVVEVRTDIQRLVADAARSK